MASPGALAELDIESSLQRISAGTLMRQIAAEHGVSKVAIYKRLSQHPDYRQAVVLQAESLVEQATQEVFECDADTVNIARARVDAAHKWAAARDPANWAQKQQVSVQVSVNLDGSGVARIGDLIDGVASVQKCLVSASAHEHSSSVVNDDDSQTIDT